MRNQCWYVTGSFPGVKCSQDVLLTTQPLLVPWSWKSRAIPVTTPWATTGPVTGTLTFLVLCHVSTEVKSDYTVDLSLCICAMLHCYSISHASFNTVLTIIHWSEGYKYSVITVGRRISNAMMGTLTVPTNMWTLQTIPQPLGTTLPLYRTGVSLLSREHFLCI